MKNLLQRIIDTFCPQRIVYSCRLTLVKTDGVLVKAVVDLFRNNKRIESYDFNNEVEAKLLYDHINTNV